MAGVHPRGRGLKLDVSTNGQRPHATHRLSAELIDMVTRVGVGGGEEMLTAAVTPARIGEGKHRRGDLEHTGDLRALASWLGVDNLFAPVCVRSEPLFFLRRPRLRGTRVGCGPRCRASRRLVITHSCTFCTGRPCRTAWFSPWPHWSPCLSTWVLFWTHPFPRHAPALLSLLLAPCALGTGTTQAQGAAGIIRRVSRL